MIRKQLKAETLLTGLLQEKLYSKELGMEQLQAELAAAIRGNDILKCEVQNAEDNFSCIKHKMKELELLVSLNTSFSGLASGDANVLLFISIRQQANTFVFM